MNTLSEKTQELLHLLGHDEEPLGIYFTDEKPDGTGPRPGPALSVEAERAGELDQEALYKNFSCVMAKIFNVRRQKKPTWLAADAYGCLGASFYAGFHKPALDGTLYYVSTGIPGVMDGERFLPSPEKSREFFAFLDPVPAAKKYCVIQPLSLFSDDDPPLIVAFFARGELLSALMALAAFAGDDSEMCVAPFGAGCGNLIAWPLHYKARGVERAVIGGNDVSCRSFYKPDELSLALPLSLYEKMLAGMHDSFLSTKQAEGIQKRVAMSESQWKKESKS